MEEKKKEKKEKNPAIFQRIAISFVLIVAIILVAVLYVSTVQATIIIKPVVEKVNTDFILDVVKTPTKETDIRGRVISGTLTKTENYKPSSGALKEIEGVGRGKVTIYNTSAQSQPLVKTTRLLTPEGLLFRIDESVEAPAGGEIIVNAYSDAPGVTGDIGPTRFTIPGLAESRQAQVYAESKESFSGGIQKIAVISQDDIDKSIGQLKEKLEGDAKTMLREEAGENFEGETFLTTILEQAGSVEPGTEANSFDVTVTIRLVGVFYDSQSLNEIASRKLFENLSSGKEFREIKTDQLQAIVGKVDTEEELANIRVKLEGDVVPSTTSKSLEVGRFIGMSEDAVRQTLLSDGVAEEVRVRFSPFWIKSIPRLKDHIYIEIE